MKGVLLAGGHGTRLRPLTHTGPKQLLPVANKPMLLYGLEDLRDAGITEIGVILGDHRPELVRELLGDGSSFGVRVTYIPQGKPLGIAHAVKCAREFVGDGAFVVYLGDNILKGGIRPLVERFRESRCEALVALSRHPEPQRFGVAVLDGRGRLVRLVEKPKEPISDLALVGVYCFRSSIFGAIRRLKPSWRNEYEITEAIDSLLRRGKPVETRLLDGWWKDTGRPEDILEANRLLLEDLKPRIRGTVESGARVSGSVDLGADSVIRAGASVRGPAIIGSRCVVGPGTSVGPYSAIGDACTLEGVEIEDSILVGDVTLACRRRLVKCLIGKGSVIESRGKGTSGERLILGENSRIEFP